MPKGEPIDDEGLEQVELNMGQVKIKFFDPMGKPATVGTTNIKKCGFEIEGPGIDPLRVRRVIIPPLDYSSPDPLTIKVEMYPGNVTGANDAGETEDVSDDVSDEGVTGGHQEDAGPVH